ncbi:hypothetical protein VKT23_004977 [Stygiomarasmius scandens]|uniref:Uncharacterized protein n=1 Tax=Marasmiellus scandens TaxID=2682957 RepID=A0ABR1JTS7_9AGAR
MIPPSIRKCTSSHVLIPGPFSPLGIELYFFTFTTTTSSYLPFPFFSATGRNLFLSPPLLHICRSLSSCPRKLDAPDPPLDPANLIQNQPNPTGLNAKPPTQSSSHSLTSVFSLMNPRDHTHPTTDR